MCLLLALAFAWMAFGQSTGKTVRHHKVAVDDSASALTDAEAALEKKDYATAESLLKKALEQDADNYTAWFDLGFVYNELGRSDDSIAAYRKSVAAKPDVFESNLNLGLMLAKSRQPEAEKYLRAASGLTPTNHVEEGRERAWLSLAHLLENRKPKEALEAYRQAALLEPKDPEPHIAAGLLLERQKDAAGAEKEYQQVLALDVQSLEALTGLANIYMQSKRLPEGEAILRKLLAARPDDAGIHVQLGRMLAAAGKYDDAITELQAGLKLQPTDSAAQRDLADVLALAGKYAQAEAIYVPLLAAKPGDADLHHSLGVALLKQMKFPEAQNELLAAVKIKPDFGAAYGDLATAASENKDYALAIKAVDARAKFLPEVPVSYFLRASAYDHLSDYKQAAQNYHRFLEMADGKFPDQEWQARHRLITIEPKK